MLAEMVAAGDLPPVEERIPANPRVLPVFEEIGQYGGTWRPHEFYEDSFLRAFPAVLDEVPSRPVFTPEEEVRNCYTWRTLVRFAGFLGLAAVEPLTDEVLCREYRVKALPLLHETVQFHLSG